MENSEISRVLNRFADLLENIPVHVILNAKAALLGAAHYGLTFMEA